MHWAPEPILRNMCGFGSYSQGTELGGMGNAKIRRILLSLLEARHGLGLLEGRRQ